MSSPADPHLTEVVMPVLTDASGHMVVTTRGHGTGLGERRRGLARLSQFIDYAFWLLYTLLFLRLLLVFFHANGGAPFVRLIDGATSRFYWPFQGIFATRDVDGGYTLAIPLLVAIAAYGILHLAINKLLRVIAYRRTVV